MEIVINKKAISVTDKYEISIDGKTNYSASRQLLDLLWVTILKEESNSRPLITISRSSFNAKYSYDIVRWDNNILQFHPNGNNYCCQCGDDRYDIYPHKGRKYSIFKNNKQVAFWDKKAESWFSANHYEMIADNDCDVEMVICFCIIADIFSKDEEEGGIFNIDVGNYGTGLKEFDSNWTPKK